MDLNPSHTPSSRRSFLAKSAALGALTLPGLAGMALADHRDDDRRRGSDNNPNSVFVDIRKDRLLSRNFESIQQHENDHVAFLVQALGANARPEPTFQNLEQRNLRRFARLSRDFENVGVGAYLGAAPSIEDSGILAAAGSIATVEARHAGFLNVALGFSITLQNVSFEDPLTPQEVEAAVAPYVASLNGGPPLTYSTTPSAQNDIDILNFALALEYLEAEYYNINVPLFFD